MIHWTHKLPEVGRQGIRLGNQQLCLLSEIKDMEERIEALRLQYKDEEKNIFDIISDSWTADEIEQAKIDAIKENSEI